MTATTSINELCEQLRKLPPDGCRCNSKLRLFRYVSEQKIQERTEIDTRCSRTITFPGIFDLKSGASPIFEIILNFNIQLQPYY